MSFGDFAVPAPIVLIGGLIVWLSIRRIVRLRTKNHAPWRNLIERSALSVAALAALGVAGSSVFNAMMLHHTSASRPGATYEVDGHRMHMDCVGNGSQTIVLDAGLGDDGLIWGGVQPVLAKSTRVCSYDRAGFGLSDALPGPRDADHIAAELHGLLAAAGIDGPIVLMGHSIAGIYIRDYATKYPADVAGLIFVDGSTPLQDQNPAFKALERKGRGVWLEKPLMEAAVNTGIPRWFGFCSRQYPGFDARAAKLFSEDQCNPKIAAVDDEMASFDQSGEETVHSGPYGELPILIFSQDPTRHVSAMPIDLAKAWEQMQKDLMKLSAHSRRIIAKGSGHAIHLERPDLIEREARLFLAQIRGTAPQGTDYGSTTTE
jgi:pimeloyl-ACP methyl ester carboxylesterase